MARTLTVVTIVVASSLVGISPAQQVVPELNSSEVSWEVVPEMVVRDNYGRHVSSKYIAVDLAVHNPSPTATLIIRAFEFRLQNGTQIHLNSDPRLVRGSLEKGQMTGRRNVSITIIKSMGLVASGFSGFFKNTGSSATYNRSVVIFSDPFEKGLEAIYPDTTIKYLSNWDADKVFKDGFVVTAGDTERGRIFIAIQAIYPDYKKAMRNPQFFTPEEVKTKLGLIRPVGLRAASVTALK